MDGWMDKKNKKNMDGWMDKKIYEKRWMVGWIKKKKKNGWLDG